MKQANFDHCIPTRILFGAGRLNDLATLPLPGKKALIVISSGKSMRANGYLERVVDLLQKNGASSVVFDKILPNPIKSHVMEGAKIAKENGCDFVIGLGGGSSIDSAKSIAVMATNPGDYWDYISGGTGKGQSVPNSPLPIIAITTTAGTGTEADPWTVITHEERHEKIGFGYPGTFPQIAIVDPELMVSVPPKLTAFQGFDALFHAMEGYIATIATPLSDLYALKSTALVCEYLPTAVNDGKNIEARGMVALANTISGMVESTSCCTSEHSLAHALSAFFPELPHGAALIMISKAYWGFFEKAVPERCKELAQAMKASSVVAGLTTLQKACKVADLKMSEYGIKASDLPKIVENAYDTMGGLFALDRQCLTREETLKILQESYQ